MKDDSLFCIDKARISYRIINKEAVIMNLESGAYYSLNKSASSIWQYISERKNLGQIQDFLVARFGDIPARKIREDLTSLVKELLKEKLIYKRDD